MATMQQHRDRQADDLTQDDGRNSALQADEPQVGSEIEDDAAGASGRPNRSRPKRSAQKRAASPAEDAAEEEPEANPHTVPKRPRGRPSKSTAAEAEPAQAEGDEEVAAPAGGEAMDCAVELSVGAAAPGKRGAKRAPAKRAPRKNKKQHKEQQEQSEDSDYCEIVDSDSDLVKRENPLHTGHTHNTQGTQGVRDPEVIYMISDDSDGDDSDGDEVGDGGHAGVRHAAHAVPRAARAARAVRAEGPREAAGNEDGAEPGSGGDQDNADVPGSEGDVVGGEEGEAADGSEQGEGEEGGSEDQVASGSDDRVGDSDYAPSDGEQEELPEGGPVRATRSNRVKQEPSEEHVGAVSGRKKRVARVKQEVEEPQQQDDGLVYIEEDQADDKDIFFLPRTGEEELPVHWLELDRAKAAAALRMFVYCINAAECKHVLKTLGFDINAYNVRMFLGKEKDKETGRMVDKWKPRGLPQWRSKLVEEMGNLGMLRSEAALLAQLNRLSADNTCQVLLLRFLDNYVRVHPPIEDDGSNLSEVLRDIWSKTKHEAPPMEALLGIKTIYIKGIAASDPPNRFLKQGTADLLWAHLYGTERTIKINEKKHKTPEERAVIKEWLKNARVVPNATDVHYRLYKHKKDWFVKVTVVMERFDIVAGIRDDEDKPEVPDAIAHMVEDKGTCDLLFLYRYMDAATDPKAPAVTAERVAHCEWLREDIEKVKGELVGSGILDDGQNEDRTMTVGQFEDLLCYCEGLKHPDTTNTEYVLGKLNPDLPFRPAQRHALNAILTEETSTGTGRHLWVEVPAPEQPKYNPEESRKKIHDKVQENFDLGQLRRIDESDADTGSDEDDFDPDAVPDDYIPRQGQGQGYIGQEQRMHAGRHAPEHRRQYADDSDENEDIEVWAARHAARQLEEDRREQERLLEQQRQAEAEKAARKEENRRKKDEKRIQEELHGAGTSHKEKKKERKYFTLADEQEEMELMEGVRPNIRLFYSPLLNAFYWGTNLKDMQQPPRWCNSKVRLFLGRGNMLCLEVGMGKTAVAIAAAAQPPRSTVLHCHKPTEEGEWRDEYHYEGIDGHKGYLIRGETLVIAPKTLLPQWRNGEVKLFRDTDYMKKRVLNYAAVQGKKRPILPKELQDYAMVVVNAEILQHKNVRALFQSVLWERVVVDEAHQEPKLVQNIVDLPKRSLMMLTGTPISGNVKDMQAMLTALCMPPWETLAKSAYNMGYVLQRTMIRYTFDGTQLTGQPNLILPAKHETTVMVPWNETEKAYYEHLANKQRITADQYVQERRQAQAFAAANPNRMKKRKKDPTEIKPLDIIQDLRPLRHACSGGVGVELPDDTPDFKPTIIKPDPDDPEGVEKEDWKYPFRAKIRFLLKRILKLRQDKPDDKMVIFSCFADTLSAIEQECSKEKYGLKFRTMKSSDSMKKREEAIESFRNDPPTTIFLLSTTLASVGLTLIAANHLFLMEPCLNPAQEKQAIGRIYRMGQTKEVFVERLVMEESVESRIVQLIEKRKARNRANELATCAHTKAKAVTKKKRNDGEDVSGVCQSAAIEELLHLFKPYTGQESEPESEEEPEQDAQAHQDAAEAGEGQEGAEDGADAGDDGDGEGNAAVSEDEDRSQDGSLEVGEEEEQGEGGEEGEGDGGSQGAEAEPAADEGPAEAANDAAAGPHAAAHAGRSPQSRPHAPTGPRARLLRDSRYTGSESRPNASGSRAVAGRSTQSQQLKAESEAGGPSRPVVCKQEPQSTPPKAAVLRRIKKEKREKHESKYESVGVVSESVPQYESGQME